jgi:hypothetical protein
MKRRTPSRPAVELIDVHFDQVASTWAIKRPGNAVRSHALVHMLEAARIKRDES